jgi:peptide/nickel transport system substrate-binding protein
VGFKTVKNPDYWGKDSQGNRLPYLDALDFIFISDPMTLLAAIQTGVGDATSTETGKRAADLANVGLTVEAMLVGTTSLVPDTANGDSPFSNQKVREAVEYAIDKEAIASGIGYGYWKAPFQIPPPASAIFNPNFSLGRKHDLNKAKQLMADAGFARGFKTKLISAPAGRNKDIVVALISYLSKIGIEGDVQYPDQPAFQTIQMEPLIMP